MQLKQEPSKISDCNAVGIFLEDTIVGHVPYNLSPLLSQCWRRDLNMRPLLRELASK